MKYAKNNLNRKTKHLDFHLLRIDLVSISKCKSIQVEHIYIIYLQ
jgi:hypothetical protein